MALQPWLARSNRHPGAPGMLALSISHEEWRQVAQELAAAGARLLAFWSTGDAAAGFEVCAAFLSDDAGLVVSFPIADPERLYPGVEDLFPPGARMQRAIADLAGLRSTDPDARPWLRDAAWPKLSAIGRSAAVGDEGELRLDTYPFVRVEGDGVHEIAVGSVHAGTIEPGLPLLRGGREGPEAGGTIGSTYTRVSSSASRNCRSLAGIGLPRGYRVISAVAFSWAYCQALEGLTDTEIHRAAWLRALYLEAQRIANHLAHRVQRVSNELSRTREAAHPLIAGMQPS